MMELRFGDRDFDYYEKRFSSGQNRKCIDGSVTGSNKVCAYCTNRLHPGFLTHEQSQRHSCENNNCVFYIKKERKTQNRISFPDFPQMIENELRASLAGMEGLKVMKTRWEKNRLEAYYISIADYDLQSCESSLSEKYGVEIRCIFMPTDYFRAASLIFGKQVAETY